MPLILSWVLMGNTYPVIEAPEEQNSLLGADLKAGYDSHYVLVKKIINGSLENYLPCALDDPDGPDYDELVVFLNKIKFYQDIYVFMKTINQTL